MESKRYMIGPLFSGVGEVTKIKPPVIRRFVKNYPLRASHAFRKA
jgi:hypothetical protein